MKDRMKKQDLFVVREKGRKAREEGRALRKGRKANRATLELPD